MAPVSCICRLACPVAPVVSSVVVRVFSTILCRSWLQAVAHGSSMCRLWLQYYPHLPLLLVAPLVVACGSSIYRSWLQWWLSYLSFVAPQWLPSMICRLWLQYLLSVVLSCGSSTICCRSIACGSPVSVSPVVCGSSLQYLSFVAPVSCIFCRSWLQTPVSVVAPVAVVRGSCGCRLVLWLQYLSWVSPLPLSVACGSCSPSICRLWLLWLLWL